MKVVFCFCSFEKATANNIDGIRRRKTSQNVLSVHLLDTIVIHCPYYTTEQFKEFVEQSTLYLVGNLLNKLAVMLALCLLLNLHLNQNINLNEKIKIQLILQVVQTFFRKFLKVENAKDVFLPELVQNRSYISMRYRITVWLKTPR